MENKKQRSVLEAGTKKELQIYKRQLEGTQRLLEGRGDKQGVNEINEKIKSVEDRIKQLDNEPGRDPAAN